MRTSVTAVQTKKRQRIVPARLCDSTTDSHLDWDGNWPHRLRGLWRTERLADSLDRAACVIVFENKATCALFKAANHGNRTVFNFQS
jgi:hypothetical protein